MRARAKPARRVPDDQPHRENAKDLSLTRWLNSIYCEIYYLDTYARHRLLYCCQSGSDKRSDENIVKTHNRKLLWDPPTMLLCDLVQTECDEVVLTEYGSDGIVGSEETFSCPYSRSDIEAASMCHLAAENRVPAFVKYIAKPF